MFRLVKHDIAYAVEKTLPVLLQRTGDTVSVVLLVICYLKSLLTGFVVG
jgi:hypothetical protein